MSRWRAALSIFFGLLSLAMMYRLTRDAVAPSAGLFGLGILACSAFYNYYYIHARMYPLYVVLSALTLWLYLRIVSRPDKSTRRDFIALGASAFALASTHIFSALLFAMIGAYHLVAVRKDRHWFKMLLPLMIAGALISPWLLVNFAAGIERTFRYLERGTAEFHELATVWFEVYFNGTWLLPLLAIAGLAIGWRRKLIPIKPSYFIYAPFLLAAILTAIATDAFRVTGMRLLLCGLPALALFLAAGYYALYRYRRWLLVLMLFWPLAAIALYRTGTWDVYTGGRALSLRMPPWQAIHRLALATDYEGLVLGYGFKPHHFYWPTNINYSQHFHYFEQNGMRLATNLNLQTLREQLRLISESQSRVWVFYQAVFQVNAAESAALNSTMREFGYHACDVTKLGRYTILTEYLWQPEDCRAPG